MACTYILYSKSKNYFYTGSSHRDQAFSRLIAHNNGRTRSIKSGIPWVLIHEERFFTYTEARKRELFLKMGVGRKWIQEKFGPLKEKQ